MLIARLTILCFLSKVIWRDGHDGMSGVGLSDPMPASWGDHPTSEHVVEDMRALLTQALPIGQWSQIHAYLETYAGLAGCWCCC
jgi:hypothetical protein